MSDTWVISLFSNSKNRYPGVMFGGNQATSICNDFRESAISLADSLYYLVYKKTAQLFVYFTCINSWAVSR